MSQDAKPPPGAGGGARPPDVARLPAGLLDKLVDDVLTRSDGARDEVRVLRAETITWNDGSLGCPQPGAFYTQALVDGAWVVLELRGETFDYRIGRGGSFRLCANPPPGPPRGRASEPERR